jgi:head-tail adaptor
MSAPRLSRQMVLEEGQRLPDGAGGYSTAWTALGTLWAAVEPISGHERAGESVTVSAVNYRITVRAARQGAPSRPKPDQRFREGGRVFRITAVAEVGGAGHYLTCYATEEVLA